MGKRFTDTDKWKKPFLRKLKHEHKILWMYILDECDHAGVWQVDLEVAEIKTGCKFNVEEILADFGDRVYCFSNGEKWFIKDFIEFQYGTLNTKNRVHESVISILKKNNIVDDDGKFKPLTSPLKWAKDKDKDNNKDINYYNGENSEKTTPPTTADLSYEKNTIKFQYEDFMLNPSSQKEIMAMTNGKTTKEIEMAMIGFILHLLESGQKIEDYKPDLRKHFKSWFLKHGANNLHTISKNQINAQFKKLKMYEYAEPATIPQSEY